MTPSSLSTIIIWILGLLGTGLAAGFLHSWLAVGIGLGITAIMWSITYGLTTPKNTFDDSVDSLTRLDTLYEVMSSMMGPNWMFVFFAILTLLLLLMIALYFATSNVVMVKPSNVWTWVVGIGLTAVTATMLIFALKRDNCSTAKTLYTADQNNNGFYIASIGIILTITVTVVIFAITRSLKKKTLLN